MVQKKEKNRYLLSVFYPIPHDHAACACSIPFPNTDAPTIAASMKRAIFIFTE